MTTQMKERKEVLRVELKDGTVLHSEKTKDEFVKFRSQVDGLIEMDGIVFNKFEFKKAYPTKIDSVESFILSQPKDIQERIRERADEKLRKAGTKFESIEQVQKFIDNQK